MNAINIIGNAKHLIIICCLVLVSFYSYSQTPFVKQWFTAGINSLWHFEELPDSTFVLGGIHGSNSSSPTSAIIIKCNKNGDSLITFLYDSSYIGGLELLNDSEIAVLGLYTNTYSVNLTTINLTNSDTSHQTLYPLNTGSACLYLCPDEGLVMLNYNGGGYEFIKVDSNYSMQWHTSSYMGNAAWQIKPDPLGGYVAVGNHGLVSNPYAVERLDNAGNIIWSYGYGSVPFGSFADTYVARDVVISDDSNYIVSCYRYIETFMKINRNNGDTIWTRAGRSATVINNAGNDTYITCTDDSFGLINGNGDFIWQTPIVPHGFVINHGAKTLDGGFAFCGNINYQIAVFVKLDSAGNTVNTSLYDIDKQKQVYFYPNPASDVLNYSWRTAGNFTFSVYNFFGDKVIEVKNKSEVDVSSLPAGFYVSEVKEGEKVVREKFVKE